MKLLYIIVIILFIFNGLQAGEEEESSIVLSDSNRTLLQTSDDFNLAVLAIKGWQKISFSTSLFNCPFEPCCSNYAIHAISHKGFFKGILYTADRISRCHPFALQNYSENNGSFVNEVDSKPYFKSEHIPYIAIPSSLIIPGFNKMINGRFADGMYMFMITGISAYGAYNSYQNGNELYIPLSFIFVSFYLSDIYFNILSL